MSVTPLVPGEMDVAPGWRLEKTLANLLNITLCGTEASPDFMHRRARQIIYRVEYVSREPPFETSCTQAIRDCCLDLDCRMREMES